MGEKWDEEGNEEKYLLGGAGGVELL